MKISSSYRVKCVLLGDSNVGKTTCCHLFAHNELDENISATIGIGFATKTININMNEIKNDKEKSDNQTINDQQLIIQIWDTAGQQRFESLIKSYLRDACIGIFVFDLTNRESFINLEKWKEHLDSMNNNSLIPMYIIIGTKSDLRDQQVSHHEIERKAAEWDCKYYVISCIQNNSYDLIYKIFYNSAKEFHEKMVKANLDNLELPRFIVNKSFISLNSRGNSKSKNLSCCW